MINFSIFYYNLNYRLPIVFYLFAVYLEFYLFMHYLYLYLSALLSLFIYLGYTRYYLFFWGNNESSGLVGVLIVEWEFDFISFECYFYFSRTAGAIDWTLTGYTGTSGSDLLAALACS